MGQDLIIKYSKNGKLKLLKVGNEKLYFAIYLLFFSCTLENKSFDNPIDFEANEELGIGAPTAVFYPAKQIKATINQ